MVSQCRDFGLDLSDTVIKMDLDPETFCAFVKTPVEVRTMNVPGQESEQVLQRYPKPYQ